MYCRNCKTAIPEGAVYCIECGEPVPDEEQAGGELSQQSIEEHLDQVSDKDASRQIESIEEPQLQPTKSFDSLEEDNEEEEEKTPEEQALEHLFADDDGAEKNADRADITRQIAAVNATESTPEEEGTTQLLISADPKKQTSGKKVSDKQTSDKQDNSPELTRQMDYAEVEEHIRLNDEDIQVAKTSKDAGGNLRQTQQQITDANQKTDSIRASDRHVVTAIVVVIIAIFAVIALTFGLVYFDPFGLGNTQENTDAEAEDVSGSEEEVSETADNNSTDFENEADGDIYAVASSSSSTVNSASGSDDFESSASNSATASNESYAAQDASEEEDDYVLPNAGTHYYTKDELSSYTDYQLYLARNEVYARWGRGFSNADLQNYFDSQSWYTKEYSPEDFDALPDPLNDCAKKNVDLIKEVEAERNSPYA